MSLNILICSLSMPYSKESNQESASAQMKITMFKNKSEIIFVQAST